MRYPCLGCLREAAVAVRLDRKGRPYTTCGWCGLRAFFHSPEGLRGLILVAPGLAGLMRQLGAAALVEADQRAPRWVAEAAATQAAVGR